MSLLVDYPVPWIVCIYVCQCITVLIIRALLAMASCQVVLPNFVLSCHGSHGSFLYFLMVLGSALPTTTITIPQKRNLVVFTLTKPANLSISICINWFGKNCLVIFDCRVGSMDFTLLGAGFFWKSCNCTIQVFGYCFLRSCFKYLFKLYYPRTRAAFDLGLPGLLLRQDPPLYCSSAPELWDFLLCQVRKGTTFVHAKTPVIFFPSL